VVDYTNISITENTRCSYPIEYIPNAKIPCVGGHPKNVIFLTCDAFGVLPPVSKLTPDQAMYHFISGYTAKVAGTEMGVKDPEATFSACFGAAFMVWHPTKYAELLAEKMPRSTNARRGWSTPAGAAVAYGVGKRMSSSTRARSSTRSTTARSRRRRRSSTRSSGCTCRPPAPTCRRDPDRRRTRGPTRPPTTTKAKDHRVGRALEIGQRQTVEVDAAPQSHRGAHIGRT
jgi:hypothetical protein